MKKIIIFVLTLFLLTSCGKGLDNVTSPHDLFVPTKFLEHFDCEINDIPKFSMEFEGSFNIIADWKENELILSNNDDFKVSDLIKKIIDENEYEVLISETESMETTKMNGFEGEKRKTKKLIVDDETVYNELVCVNLENGLKLTIQFRRFVSENITYYAWQYRNSLRMVLHYPIMVIKKNDVNKLILLTLPNNFSNYTVNFQLGVENLIGDKDKYLFGKYTYSFNYVNVDTTNPVEVDNAISKIKDYYKNKYEGIENESFEFVYLGNRFSIDFNASNFVINYLESN